MDFTLIRGISGVIATAVGVRVAAEGTTIRVIERVILGVPESWLLAAITGALIGVMLLPDKEACRIYGDKSASLHHRIAQSVVRSGALALVITGYAILTAWTIALAGVFYPYIIDNAALPAAGVLGVFIRRLLPAYLRLIERITGGLGESR